MKALEPKPVGNNRPKNTGRYRGQGQVYNLTHYGAFVELEKALKGFYTQRP